MQDTAHTTPQGSTERITTNTAHMRHGVTIRAPDTRKSGHGIKLMDPKLIMRIRVVTTLLIMKAPLKVITAIVLTVLTDIWIMEVWDTTRDGRKGVTGEEDVTGMPVTRLTIYFSPLVSGVITELMDHMVITPVITVRDRTSKREEDRK